MIRIEMNYSYLRSFLSI